MQQFVHKILLSASFFVFAWVQISVAQVHPDSSGITSEKVKHWAFNGYLKDLQSIGITDINKKWTLDNLIHNRIDLHWYADSLWKVHIGWRNRLIFGESVALYQQNGQFLDGSNNFLDLSKTIASGESYLLHSSIDRANIDFTKGKWQVTLGRQRINWGVNMVWNPNDIFNAYSYFDFDYEERPGSDALRVQYYLSSTASAELAYKPGLHAGETVAAALYRFNRRGYDIQILSGIMKKDFVIGAGWSGVLGQAGFNGEISGFTPTDSFQLSNTMVSASAGINYTFPNSLYLHGAYLLNTAAPLHPDSSRADVLFNNVSAKSLAGSRHSLFAEAAFQFTPLIRADLAGIINPSDGSFFAGPFITFSLTNSMELLTGGQLFFGRSNSLYGGYGKIILLRFKWSF